MLSAGYYDTPSPIGQGVTMPQWDKDAHTSPDSWLNTTANQIAQSMADSQAAGLDPAFAQWANNAGLHQATITNSQ